MEPVSVAWVPSTAVSALTIRRCTATSHSGIFLSSFAPYAKPTDLLRSKHIGGKRELVAPLCQQAMDLSFDGLIIESHCNPDCAWSDASQQITPDVLDYVLNLLVIRDSNQTTENLTELRRQIDGIDEQLLELLAKRMRISREIGVYKKEHNMPILQSPRYSEILEKRSNMGEQMDLSTDFVKEILKEIHEESVRQQMIIMNEQ